MKFFIGLCLLLVTVYALPTENGHGSANAVSTAAKDERPTREKFTDILKDIWDNLLQHFKKVFKAKSKKFAGALIELTSGETWDEVVPSLFEGNASQIAKEFLALLQGKQSNHTSMKEFFKDQIDEMLAELLIFFGAKGDDLLTVSTNLVNDTTHKLLTVFASNLSKPEVEAISAAVSGIGGTIAKIVIKTEDWLKNLLNYLRKEMAQLVKVILKRWLDHEGIIYQIIEKVLSMIQPKDM
ncbi:hypothetical protein AAHC03_09992 [Spirometra sp. Aus1]